MKNDDSPGTARPDAPLVAGFWFVAIACAYLCACKSDVLFDDAFVYLRVAHNWIELGKPVFNASDTHFPATSPLWTAILACGRLFTPAVFLPLLAKWLWICLLTWAAWLAFRLFRPSLGCYAVLIPLPFLLPDYVCACMGNEIALIFVASMGLLWACRRGNPYSAGFWIGVGYLCRGEFVLAAVPVAFHFLTTVRREREWSPAQSMLALSKAGVVALGIALVWHVYYFAAFGLLFPSTLAAKMAQGKTAAMSPYWMHLGDVSLHYLHEKPLLLALVALGLFRHRYLGGLWLVFIALHFALYAWLGVPAYHWYYWSTYLFLRIFLFLGVCHLAGGLAQLKWPALFETRLGESAGWPRNLAGMALVALFSLSLDWPGAGAFSPSRAVTNTLRFERAEAYQTLVSRLQGCLKPGDVLLTPEIGIIGWYLRDYEVRDVNGLANPDIRPEDVDQWPVFVKRYEPSYLLYLMGNPAEHLEFQGRNGLLDYDRLFVTAPDNPTYQGVVYRRVEGGAERQGR